MTSNNRSSGPGRILCLTVLIFTLSLPGKLFSQPGGATGDPFKVNIVPPSPEASALAKYADIPVSLYSGTPQITIPLYELRERELTLPIALNYHASGNKVETISGRTGLGWSLEAGGVITRTMVGWPDEHSTKGFLHQSREHEISDFAIGILPAEQQFPWYDAMANGCMDMEPDIFYFNFGGYSGKFMFNWDGQIEIASGSNLKITPLGMNPGTVDFIDGFEVVAEDGTVFVFDVIETTDIIPPSPTIGCELALNELEMPLSWYVSEIRSANQQSWIRFEYEPYHHTTEAWSMETQVHDLFLAPAAPQRHKLTLSVQGKQLRRITTSSGQTIVDFLNGEQRTDVDGMAFTLGGVTVKNSLNRVIRDWRMDYDYSTGRLTLKKVTEWAGGSSKPPYLLNYYAGSLPSPTSFARDHWGFANSNGANTMIPATTARRLSDFQDIQLSGADRDPSPSKILMGMLKEITYPTGGKDVLQFESHDYSFRQHSEMTTEVTIPRVYNARAPGYGTPPGEWDENETVFTLTSQIEGVEFEASITYGMTFGNSAFPVSVTFKNITTGDELIHFSPGGSGTVDGNGEITPEIKTLSRVLTLQPGVYSLTVRAREPLGGLIGHNSGGASIRYDEPTGEFHTDIKQGGGVRIARITRSFGNGSPDKVTRYLYRVTENGEEKSSGSLLESAYRYEEWVQYQELPIGGGGPLNGVFEIVPKFFRYSQNRCALGTTHGSHVGYFSVTVLEGENGENGKTVYSYTSPREETDQVHYEIPYPPADSYDYLRGKLLEQSEHNSAGVLLRKTIHKYRGYKKKVPALKVGWKRPGAGPVGADFLDRYALGNYENILGYVRLTETEEKTFHGSSPAVLTFVNNQLFRYNETSTHRQLVEVAGKNSEGDSVFTKMTYPQDYAVNVNTPLGIMKSRHIANQVVEKISWQKSASAQTSLLAAQKTDFRVQENKVYPSALLSAAITDPIIASNPMATAQNLYEERLQYLSYDASGNLTGHAMKNGVRTAYQWGWNGTVIVAKADHSRTDQIFHTSFEEDLSASTLHQKTGQKSKAINGTYSIPTAVLPPSGNYILSYWVSDGVSWTYREKQIQNYQQAAPIVTDAVNGFLDEVRLYPKGAAMTTYTYEPLVGITSVMDANGIVQYFEYDEFNRLSCKRDQDRNIIECYEYKFQEEVQYAVQN